MRASKTALGYLLCAILTALFGAVYERFSHEVYSYFMLYAFLIPLLGGALPYLASSVARVPRRATGIVRAMHHCGIATLTIGSIVRGILDIYGTTNRLINAYWIAGLLLLAGAGLLHCRRNHT